MDPVTMAALAGIGQSVADQLTTTELAISSAYTAGAFNDLLTGKTGEVNMPVKISNKTMLLSVGVLVLFYIIK